MRSRCVSIDVFVWPMIFEDDTPVATQWPSLQHTLVPVLSGAEPFVIVWFK